MNKMGHKDSAFPEPAAIHAGEKIIDFSTVRIMGILNLTPDSFFDGGRYVKEKYYREQTAKMLEQGADIIDLGGVSTRPGSKPVSEKEELQRLIPALQQLTRNFPQAVFSVDTYRANVAKAAINEGAHIINDISGGIFDKAMFETVAELKVPYVLMHIHGTPETMQINPVEKDIVREVRNYFEKKVAKAKKAGIKEIILDPGFGFGKSMPCNYALLRNLNTVRTGNLPVLAGVSRKSLVNKILDTVPADALNGTTVLHTIAIANGANILRVHDVKEAAEAIKLIEYYKVSGSNC